MGIDRVRTQLEKFGLASAKDEMSIVVQAISPYYMFGDSSGDRILIAQEDDVSQAFNKIAYRMGKVGKEEFWSGSWLGKVPFYRGLDELWNAHDTRLFNISVPVSRSSEKLFIGRAKRLNKDIWLFESEEGEYGLVPERDARKWYKE